MNFSSQPLVAWNFSSPLIVESHNTAALCWIPILATRYFCNRFETIH